MPSYSQQLSRLAALFGGNQNSYGLPLANRNYIVDGNFEQSIAASVAVAAAGSSSGVATMYYGVAGATNGGTLAVNAAPWALGAEPNGMTSPAGGVLTWTQASAATTNPQIEQRVENVATLQGRAATFSCWLWCASGTQTVSNVQVVQNFGSGGSPSGSVTTNVPVNWALTTTPQRFSALVSLPSVSGKTLGTAGSYLQVGVQYPSGTTYTINTAQWQLEQSSPNAPAAGMPTAFEYRGAQAELARVNRYYEQWGAGVASEMFGTGFFQNATTAYVPLKYTRKRAAPTVTLPVGSFQCSNGTSNYSVSGFTPAAPTQDSVLATLTVSGAVANAPCALNAANTTCQVVIDARL